MAPCHLVRQNHTQCITRHLYGLCNSDDEDVVLPAVMLSPVVVIFLPGATEADVDIVAKLLDETKQCEQSQICRKIKEMLKDKITEGKITEKWIEECLPHEYKRKYVKSELTSLSQDENGTKEKILVDTSGRSSIAKALLSSDTSGSSNNSTEDNNAKFKASKTNQNLLVGSDNQDTSYETDCLRCKELEDALLRASSVVSADKLQNENKTYLIPKEKHGLLMEYFMEAATLYCNI